MYTEAQRRKHILDLQRFLRRIEQEQGKPEPLAPDGIFGPSTAESVRDFQRQHGLRPTGTADAETWNLVFAHYAPLAQSDQLPIAVQFFPPESGAHFGPGDKGCPIYVVQGMLNTMAAHFSGVARVPLTGEYDAETEHAVRSAQLYFQLSQTGIVDRTTWDSLAAMHNAYHYRPPLSWVEAEQK